VRFLALRFLVGGGLLLVIALLRQRGALARAAAWRDGAILGAVLFLSYGTQTAGLVFTTPAVSAFLTSLSVVLVPVLAVAFLGDRVNRAAWLGVGCAGLGLVALTAPGGGLRGFGPGEALTLGTAVGFAAHFVLTARFAGRTPALALAAVQLSVCGALAIGLVGFDRVLERAGATVAPAAALFAPLPAVAWLEVVGMGVGATALAFFLQTWAQRRLSATRTGVIFALEPVFAVMFSALFFGERIGARAALGMGLILAGVIVVGVRGMEPAAVEREP
jgi:drug/metabolite transporter (DMT)-like permease